MYRIHPFKLNKFYNIRKTGGLENTFSEKLEKYVENTC